MERSRELVAVLRDARIFVRAPQDEAELVAGAAGPRTPPRPEEPAFSAGVSKDGRRLLRHGAGYRGGHGSSPSGLRLAHHGCPDSVISGIHGQHTRHHAFSHRFRSWMPNSARETSTSAEPCRQAWLGCEGEARGAKPRRDSPRRCLGLSTAFAPACGHMTDRRRYRDSAATQPPSESRGDIRYLLCFREIVPRIHPLTPAFRGSFRFEHYPLTGAAESS